ncbi:MAG: Mo-dependent nitrogenase C-terminal domain-containing protein [Leptolyngbyaceae bacterium]|nr:Mo-dependent nitrogenase C-terminal domain-containing protein [Leptolyngbyaceae bacterium]
MVSTFQSPYRPEQIAVWLRGLSTVAWADGHFDPEEQEMIASLAQAELAPEAPLESLQPITPQELADGLGDDPSATENFMRTAVMVAIADGVYSPPEDALLQQFCEVLGCDAAVLESLRSTLPPSEAAQAAASASEGDSAAPTSGAASSLYPPDAHGDGPTPLRPVKEWLDHMEVHDPSVARFLCKMIPPQCPFERDVKLFGHKVVHIPPLCKLNPLYDQLVGLRFRALSYLADDCGEDVTPYC